MATTERAKPRVRLTREERRESLLQAATKTFARKGFSVATVSDIAKEAGVTEPLIYKHFPSKQSLYVEVFKRVAQFFETEIAAIIAEGHPPVRTLEDIALFYFRYLQRNLDFARILYQVSAQSEDGLQGLVEPLGFMGEVVQRLVQLVESLIRTAQEQGDVPEDLDAVAASWMFVGNYHILILMRTFDRKDLYNEDMVRSMLATILWRPAHVRSGESGSEG